MYDPFFLHTSGYNTIDYDYGYFFSLDKLVTKTKKDILLNFPKNNINIPKEKFLLFLEEKNSPSYNSIIVRRKIEKEIQKLGKITVIHKLHLNLQGQKIHKLNTKNKVIIADQLIPAEYFIPFDRSVIVYGN